MMPPAVDAAGPLPLEPPAPAVDDGWALRVRAAQAFVRLEWAGATLMIASFSQLYLAAFGPFPWSAPVALVVGAVMLLVGASLYMTARRGYAAIDVPWARRSHAAAAVVAGSGAIFWLLLAVLVVLASRGVAIT